MRYCGLCIDPPAKANPAGSGSPLNLDLMPTSRPNGVKVPDGVKVTTQVTVAVWPTLTYRLPVHPFTAIPTRPWLQLV